MRVLFKFDQFWSPITHNITQANPGPNFNPTLIIIIYNYIFECSLYDHSSRSYQHDQTRPHLTSSPITRAYMICREFRRRSYKSTYQTQIMTYEDFSNLTIQGIIFFNISFGKWKSTIFVHVLKPLIRNSDSYLSR